MADNHFAVNTDGMGPAVDGLKSLGDRLSQITQQLESTLDGLGKPWGEDKNGENFFKQYGTSRDQTLSGVASMADATHGVAQGINSMIKGYNKIDDNSTQTAQKLARTSDGSGGGNYGYAGSSYSSSDGDNPQMGYERRRLMPETPGTPTKRMAALRPTEMGTPPVGEDGTPLRPMERLQAREGERLLPAEEGVPAGMERGTLREGTLLQPATMREGTAIPDDAPVVPEGQVSEPLAPEARVMPAEPLRPVDRGIPAEPLQPMHPRMRAERLDPMQPAHEGTTEAEQPRLFDRIPATPAEPRFFKSVHEGVPAERMEALQPAERGIPAEPLQPLQRVEGHMIHPAHEGIPAAEQPREFARLQEPTVPLQPAHLFERVQEGTPVEAARLEPAHEAIPATPLEPTRAFERVQEGTPAEPARLEPAHVFMRSERPMEGVPAIPAEPRGFAELEPARFMPAEPENPGVPPVQEQ